MLKFIHIIYLDFINSINEVNQFLDKIIGKSLDLSSSKLVLSRKSLVEIKDIPADDTPIEELPPYMKFVSRTEESNQVFKLIQNQLEIKFSETSEPLKKVIIPTVAGTAGKGKYFIILYILCIYRDKVY